MIGIFDSGIGGLTLVKEFQKELPQYKIIYFGDTARLPYGTKSPELVKKWSKEIVNFLLKKKAKIIIIACHTSSALASDYLKKEFPEIPIFEIISPSIKSAEKSTRNKKIGIIATPGTIKSNVHKNKLLAVNPNLKVYNQACPLFVPLIEEGWIKHPVTKKVIKEYLLPLKKKNIDTLLLGCTHYPLLEKTISEIIGDNVKIINPGYDFILDFKNKLKINKNLEKKLKKNTNHQFFVSDNPYNFKTLSKLCLKKEIKPKKINL